MATSKKNTDVVEVSELAGIAEEIRNELKSAPTIKFKIGSSNIEVDAKHYDNVLWQDYLEDSEYKNALRTLLGTEQYKTVRDEMINKYGVMGHAEMVEVMDAFISASDSLGK